MALGLYFMAVFVVSLMLADLNALRLLGVGTYGVYPIDLLNFAAAGLALYAVVTGALQRLSRPGTVYVLFLVALFVALAHGSSIYGWRALGEFRYVFPLFWFFVPLAIQGTRRVPAGFDDTKLLLRTIEVAAAAAVVMLAIELASGGRVFLAAANREALRGFTDFRGVRYLDSYQTFSLVLLGGLLFMKRFGPERGGAAEVVAGCLLWGLALLTRNRAAVLALGAAIVLLGVLEKRFRLLFGFAAAAVAGGVLVMLLSAPMWERISNAFTRVLSPGTDPTGRWRLLVQIAALQQALDQPWFGQGFGGYFLFEVPGLRAPVEAPPHNQFVLLFLKGGALAVLMCVAAVWGYARGFWRAARASWLPPWDRFACRAMVLFLGAQVVYGFAYDFVPLFGLLLGFGERLLQAKRDWRPVVPRGVSRPPESASAAGTLEG